MLKKFSEFLKEWSFEPGADSGHGVGTRVRVNRPGHADHGREGRILRHHGVESLVDFGAGHGASTHNRLQHLTPIK